MSLDKMAPVTPCQVTILDRNYRYVKAFDTLRIIVDTQIIKTHDSESRGQEEAGHTRRTSELFTRSTALKFVNALNKPP